MYLQAGTNTCKYLLVSLNWKQKPNETEENLKLFISSDIFYKRVRRQTLFILFVLSSYLPFDSFVLSFFGVKICSARRTDSLPFALTRLIFRHCLLCIYIYIYICVCVGGWVCVWKRTEIKKGWSYLLNFLYVHRGMWVIKRNEKYESVLKHSISVGSVLFQIWMFKIYLKWSIHLSIIKSRC